MSGKEWKITVGDAETSALFEPADGESRALFVAAHGAGGNMRDKSMTATAARLRERGISVVRFNFLYKEKGSGRPDPMPRLESCIEAVVDHARRELDPELLIIGGRSMGGRAASMLAAKDFRCDGLLLLAYPLHPAGKPEQLRDAHLPEIRVPTLCLSGTRDPLCTPALMEEALRKVRGSFRMHWVEGADHSFHVLKSSGRTDAEVLQEIADAAAAWVGSFARPGS